MTLRHPLPPRRRSRLGLQLTEIAAYGEFRLPRCRDCNTVQYPVRDICSNCLSDRIEWTAVSNQGVLLSQTRIHHSVEPFHQRSAPVRMGSVKLDEGPVLIAFVAGDVQPGARCRVALTLDQAGQAIFIAASEGPSMETLASINVNCGIAGRVVVIVGADNEIGRALGAAFEKAGALEVLKVATHRGAPAVDHGCAASVDLTSCESIRQAVGSISSRTDILVNAAAVNARQPSLLRNSDQTARLEMEMNYFGLINVTRQFAPSMVERGRGAIVNVLSLYGKIANPLYPSYCASMAAADSLTQTMRAELTPLGVRVCGVYAGAIDTPEAEMEAPPKISPSKIASETIAAFQKGVEDVFVGTARDAYAAHRGHPKVVEREMSS